MPRFPSRIDRVALRFTPILVLAVFLTACGAGNPEPTPEPTNPPAPTAAPGELSVGDLVDRVNAAWPQVRSLRATSMSGPVPTDGPDSTPASGVQSSIEEAVAPDTRRIVRMTDGAITDEQIWVNGTVYMWGVFVANAVAPEVGDQVWVTVDPTIVPAESPVGRQLSYLTRPLDSPFTAMTDDLRAQPAQEAGEVEVGGRVCRGYTFADSTASGTRIDYELALDDAGLPCQLVRRAGGFQDSSVFEVNVAGLQIVAPDAPTPVSGTPEG